MRAEGAEVAFRWTAPERALHAFLLSRSAVLVPIGLYLAFAWLNWNAWHCPDDPLTVWAALWPESFEQVRGRSHWLPQLPTYFWLARATALLGGGLMAIRLGSEAAGLAAVLLAYGAGRWLAPRSYLAVGFGSMVGILTSFAYFYGCARPYAWLPLLFLLQLVGIACAFRKQPILGIALVGTGGGLAAQFSAIALPTAATALALAVSIAIARGTPLLRWLVPLCAVAPLYASATTKALRLASVFGPSDQPGDFWLSDAPALFPQAHAAVIAIAAAATLALRAARCHRVLDPLLSNRGIAVLSGLGLLFPGVVLALHFVAGLNLYAPWYFAFENLVAILLLCVLVTGLGDPRVQLHGFGAALALGVAVCAGLDAWITRAIPEYRWDANHDVYRYLLGRAQPEDLVIVTSLWPNADVPAFYEHPDGRSLLLSEALLYPGVAALSLYPAPGGPSSPNPVWCRAIAERLRANPRVWLVKKAWLKRIWRDDAPPWALEQLRRLGYVPLPGAVDPDLEARLVLLERADREPIRASVCSGAARLEDPPHTRSSGRSAP